MTAKEAPEDLGAPIAHLVLKDGTSVYDRSGGHVGDVEHVLADDHSNVFHGLILKTADGHRFASADKVDGMFENGVIVAAPADQLPTPSEDAPAQMAEEESNVLKRAWEWLVQPK